MIRSSLIAAFALLAFSAAPVFSQTPATGAGQGNVPVSKVAVIFSAAFQDPKAGIARFTGLLTKLNAEFQKVQDDLNQTAGRLKTMQDEITKLQATPGATPAQIQAKIETLDQQKKDYQRRGEDAQASYQRRRTELFTPLQDDVGKALDKYAKDHGIGLVIDGSQVEGILYADASLDITRQFISDYNIKNPATAALTPPK